MATGGKPQNHVAQLYQTVIEDVINNVRDSFLDDGVDEQVLKELKQIWESKLSQTKAVESPTLGGRGRPPVYTYLSQPKPGQPMIYQAITAQQVQFSLSSQHNRRSIYQQGDNIVLPSQNRQLPVFTPYQPMAVLQQPVAQVRPVGGSGQAIVLASTPHPGASQQPQSKAKPNSSNVIQVDGCNDDAFAATSHQGSTSWSISSLLKKPKTAKQKLKHRPAVILQVDGRGDSSSSDDDIGGENDDGDDDGDEDDDDEDEEAQEEEKPEEEPLNSEDDDSDQDASELFDTDNVIVCQYDKIHRAKAKWKFNLKVGIMNLEGKDRVFQKANGEADW